MFGTDYYDSLLLSGEPQVKQTRELEKLRNLPEKEIKIVGITYLDEMKKRLDSYTSTSNKKDKTTVLLAPSWGPSGLLTRYGADLLDELVKTGYHIVVRPHPQSFTSEAALIEKLMKQFPENDNFEWNRDNDNFDCLNRSDIMISDFSGVIFEFALVFDKPVICADTEFDSSPYDAWWLGRLPWGQTAIPRIGKILTKENFSEIKNMIDTCIEDKSFEESRHAVRDETWTHRGEGAKLAADYITEKYKEIKAAQ
jgi:CDP-glycerol glycerophosphotransferase (TagB/SpsB family)